MGLQQMLSPKPVVYQLYVGLFTYRWQMHRVHGVCRHLVCGHSRELSVLKIHGEEKEGDCEVTDDCVGAA